MIWSNLFLSHEEQATIQPSRILHNLQGRPVILIDMYYNFYWIDKDIKNQFRLTDIPYLKYIKDVQISEEETKTT